MSKELVVGKIKFDNVGSPINVGTSNVSCDCGCGKEQPYKCPVCVGRGRVERGFYDSYNKYPWELTSTARLPNLGETCRTCSGSGVIWK